MRWLKTALQTVLGLFIDRGGLAIAIVLWLFVAWLAFPYLPATSVWRSVTLFLGLATILVGAVLRDTRRN